MTRSTTVRTGVYPLYAIRGVSGSRTKRPGNRYFKPFRGIVLHKIMKRHGIKFGVLIDLCKESGNILGYYFDALREIPELVIMIAILNNRSLII
jgi:hypothetical protein